MLRRNRDRKKPRPSFVQLPSQTVLSTSEMELAMEVVDKGMSGHLDLWSINPPESLQHLSPEDWAMVSAVWTNLLQQQAMSNLH